MTEPWSPPQIKPFERLQVKDGLLMNTQRWQLAHQYHRQKQNLHYQSLNQPGIVCGLGVFVIDPPSEYKAEYRDQRWVEIQPGIAIDRFGNVIVIPEHPVENRRFHIDSKIKTESAQTVYLVLSYVDPDELDSQSYQEVAKEQFRIDETLNPSDKQI
jgi:hypothetical protein